jgi:hypothetical protein
LTAKAPPAGREVPSGVPGAFPIHVQVTNADMKTVYVQDDDDVEKIIEAVYRENRREMER